MSAVANKPGKSGFTLLEVVIVILMVATMAMAFYPSYIKQSRTRVTETFAQELNYALEACRRYYSVHKNFPESWDVLKSEKFIPDASTYSLRDPFSGQIPVLTAYNNNTPKYMTITINEGVARQTNELGNLVISRVPFAYRAPGNPNQIVIYQSELQNYLDREVVYVGVHKHGDTIQQFQCQAGTKRYAVATPLSLLTPDSSPMVGYRVSLLDNGSNYVVQCDLKSSESSGLLDNTNADACWAVVMQICH